MAAAGRRKVAANVIEEPMPKAMLAVWHCWGDNPFALKCATIYLRL